jgi:hypothetical protein
MSSEYMSVRPKSWVLLVVSHHRQYRFCRENGLLM